MINRERLEQLVRRYEFVEAQLSVTVDPNELKHLGQEYAELKPIINEVKNYKKLKQLLTETIELLNEPEMRSLASEEVQKIEKELRAQEDLLMMTLIPTDKNDSRSVILELRAGTGGDEASLFAGSLLKMYQRYSENSGWSFDILEHSFTEVGGIREAVVSISGKSVYKTLKYESGVHRVQRVPETESSGRIHTSAATVAVLPEANEIDIQIKQEDLRIDQNIALFEAAKKGLNSIELSANHFLGR